MSAAPGVFDTNKTSLHIRVVNPVVTPGGALSGHVTVKTAAPLDNALAVRLKLVGKERLQRREYNNNSSTGVETTTGGERMSEIVSEKVCVFKTLVTLWGRTKQQEEEEQHQQHQEQVATTIPAGEFIYPFELSIPAKAPYSFISSSSSPNSSSNTNNDSDDTATIEYTLKAYVSVPFGRDAKTRVPIYVLSILPHRQWVDAVPMDFERTYDVKGVCGCGSKGAARIKFALERTVLALDRDRLVAVVDVDNSRCEADVEAVSMRVICRCRTRIRNQSGVTERPCGAVTTAGSRDGKVAAGSTGSVTLTLPLAPAVAPPSITTARCAVSYEVAISLSIPALNGGHDPVGEEATHSFPVLLSHTVGDDGSGGSGGAVCVVKSINTNMDMFEPFDEKGRREYLWQAPAQPFVAAKPIPAAAPPAASSSSCSLLPPVSNNASSKEIEPSLWGAPADAKQQQHQRSSSSSSDQQQSVAYNTSCTRWQLPTQPLRTIGQSQGSCSVAPLGGGGSSQQVSISVDGAAAGGGSVPRSLDARSLGRASFKSTRSAEGISPSANSNNGGDNAMSRADSELVAGFLSAPQASSSSHAAAPTHSSMPMRPTQSISGAASSKSMSRNASRRSSFASRGGVSSGEKLDEEEEGMMMMATPPVSVVEKAPVPHEQQQQQSVDLLSASQNSLLGSPSQVVDTSAMEML